MTIINLCVKTKNVSESELETVLGQLSSTLQSKFKVNTTRAYSVCVMLPSGAVVNTVSVIRHTIQ